MMTCTSSFTLVLRREAVDSRPHSGLDSLIKARRPWRLETPNASPTDNELQRRHVPTPRPHVVAHLLYTGSKLVFAHRIKWLPTGDRSAGGQLLRAATAAAEGFVERCPTVLQSKRLRHRHNRRRVDRAASPVRRPAKESNRPHEIAPRRRTNCRRSMVSRPSESIETIRRAGAEDVGRWESAPGDPFPEVGPRSFRFSGTSGVGCLAPVGRTLLVQHRAATARETRPAGNSAYARPEISDRSGRYGLPFGLLGANYSAAPHMRRP